jgi:hypothetical protein
LFAKKQKEINQSLANGTRQKSSQYRGVCYDKQHDKWKASIKYQGKKIHIGQFKTQEDAALAYNNKAIQLLGNKAVLNVINYPIP